MKCVISYFVNDAAGHYVSSQSDLPERELGKSYVYALVSGGVVAYVGSSLSIKARYMDHKSNKEFDGIYFIEVAPEMMLDVECYLISEINPEMNKTASNGCESFLSVTKMSAIISSYVINEMTSNFQQSSKSSRGMYHVDSVKSILGGCVEDLESIFSGNSINYIVSEIMNGINKNKEKRNG